MNIITKIVEEIVRDIESRRGLRQEWESIDEDIQDEIKDTWKKIIETNLGVSRWLCLKLT